MWQTFLLSVWQTFLLSVWTERRNKKEPRTRSAVEQMGFPVSGCGTRGFAAQTVLARDDTEKPHLLPTAPAIVRPANTPPLVGEVRRALAIVRLLSRQMCEGFPLSFATCRGRCAKGCGLKGQRAHSPRQRLGYRDVHSRPEGA